MPIVASVSDFHAEAARCERVAGWTSDPALRAKLDAWAREYRNAARAGAHHAAATGR